MTKILLIEDNPEYRAAAEQFFATQDVELDVARDYKEFKAKIANQYDGAISDCFFPEETGTGKKDLGKKVIEIMATLNPRMRGWQDTVDRVGALVTLDEELENMVRRWTYASRIYDLDQEPLMRAIERASTLGPDKAAKIVKNTLSMLYSDEHWKKEAVALGNKDYRVELEKGLEESESNQALCILAAKELENRKIPFVFATSTHHHDSMTQPILDHMFRLEIKNYHGMQDCYGSDTKTSQEFWERTYSVLERHMKEE